MRIIALTAYFLLLSFNLKGQERVQALALNYLASDARIWNPMQTSNSKFISLYSNSISLEYKRALATEWLRLNIGIHYMERGYRLYFDEFDGKINVKSYEKFFLVGLKTTTEFRWKRFVAEIGGLTQKPFARRFVFDGGSVANATEVDHLPAVIFATYTALGYSFKLAPRINLNSQLFSSNSFTKRFRVWNYGVNLGVEYQFGKTIPENIKMKL